MQKLFSFSIFNFENGNSKIYPEIHVSRFCDLKKKKKIENTTRFIKKKKKRDCFLETRP